MTELKPCPFCGGNATLVEYWFKGTANVKHYFVQCKKCGVRKDNHHNGYNARTKAIDDWNKRAKMDEVVNGKEFKNGQFSTGTELPSVVTTTACTLQPYTKEDRV